MFIRSSLSEMHGYVALSHRKYIHSFTCHCALSKAYYDHVGDEDVGYAGVPFGWEGKRMTTLHSR